MANTEVIDNLRRNIQMVGNTTIQQKMKEEERKRDLADKIRAAAASSILEGKGKLRSGVDINSILEDDNAGNILGAIEPRTDYGQLKDQLDVEEKQRESDAYKAYETSAGGDKAVAYEKYKRAGKIGPEESIQAMIDMGLLGNGGPGSVLGRGSNLPPGTTMKMGGMTIPMNQKFNEAELSSVAGAEFLDPIVQDIESSIDSGILGKTKLGNIGRTIRQLQSDSSNALFTANDPELQAFQSKMSALRKTLPFTEGGKALTDIEKKLVFALLKTTGKSDEQIKTDLNEAMGILREKRALALGGANTVKFSGKTKTANSPQIPTFNTEAEVDAANLEDGTPVMVGGQRFIYKRENANS